jgi:hypothetical protein
MEFTHEESLEDQAHESIARAHVWAEQRERDRWLRRKHAQIEIGPLNKLPGDGQWPCRGPAETEPEPDAVNPDAHLIPMLKTAYGWRAVCRKHERVWTWISRGHGPEPHEEPYGGGMMHNA